jgi:hypothetical protein
VAQVVERPWIQTPALTKKKRKTLKAQGTFRKRIWPMKLLEGSWSMKPLISYQWRVS